MANVLVRSEKKEMAMRMSAELGHLLDAAAREAAGHGSGGGAGAAAEERVPLPVPDQGGQPQGAQRTAAAGSAISRWSTSGAPRPW